MKATEQHFPVVLFITMYKVVLNFESVDEMLQCDHSNESSCGTACYAVQGSSKFLNKILTCVTFLWACFMLCKMDHQTYFCVK